MILDPDEFELFFKLHVGLMSYVDERLEIFPGRRGGYRGFKVEDRMKVHEAFNGDRAGLIDAYVAENPGGLSEAEVDEVSSWKAAITGDFFLFRQLKNHMIFLGLGNPTVAYGVVGLTQPFSEILVSGLPVLATTTLIPFRGRIVFDGIICSKRITFGSGYRASLNESFKEAKAGRGVVVSLVGDASGMPKKRVSPKERVERLTDTLREKLGEIRRTKGEIKTFTENSLPVMKKWIEENLKSEKEKLEKLTVEVEDLDFVLEEIDLAWEEGLFRTRREAAEVILAEVAKEKREAEKARRADAVAGDRCDGGGAGKEDDEDDEDEGIPDFVMDFMFETFMREMRGVDVDAMEEAEYDEARAQFEETMGHAERGDRSAFEKGLLETGADRSHENVTAVKKVFRRLAKRLHPDQNPEFCEIAKELWEELGAAKKALDLESMESLELHWQIVQGDAFSTKDERRLKEFQEDVNGLLSDLRASRRELKSHPMWGFAGKTLPPELADRVKRDMAEGIRDLEARKKELEGELSRIRGRLRRRKHAKKKVAPKKWATAVKKVSAKAGREKKANVNFPEEKRRGAVNVSRRSGPAGEQQGELEF